MTAQEVAIRIHQLDLATRLRPSVWDHTQEAAEAAGALLQAVPVGWVSDIGGQEAVKNPDGTWTIEADEDCEVQGVTVTSEALPEHWCCMNPAHWPREPAEP